MRVKIRSSLDLDKPVNLKQLSPKEKVLAGFLTQWRQTKFYKNSKRKADEMKYVEQTKKDETLKNYILAHLYNELSNNNTLKKNNKECSKVFLYVEQKYEDSLKRILPNLYDERGIPNKDFLSFNITRVEENHDLRKAFPNMKILLQAERKTL